MAQDNTMENDENGKEKLIAGITRDARKEADLIISETEKTVEGRMAAARKQAEAIRTETKTKIEEQTGEIQKKSAMSIATETRRIQLNIQKALLNRIIEEAELKIEKQIKENSYRKILKNWIVEAALGLSVEEAEINASKKEIDIIDGKLIEEAVEEIKTITGRAITLKKAAAKPLIPQGVVLSSADGKTAFNNQVHVRILRYQSEIRSLVNKRLFSGDREKS